MRGQGDDAAPQGSEGPGREGQSPSYPKTVVAAGALILIFCGFWLANAAACLVTTYATASRLSALQWVSAVVALVGVPIFSVQAIRFIRATGKDKDVDRAAGTFAFIGIMLAILWLTHVMTARVRHPYFYLAEELTGFLAAAPAFVAGVLLSRGREGYKRWREASESRRNQ